MLNHHPVDVLPVAETIYLVPTTDFVDVDHFDEKFPDHMYCPVAEANHHPRDTKLKFIVVIVTKPEISAENKLTWTVADRTGMV